MSSRLIPGQHQPLEPPSTAWQTRTKRSSELGTSNFKINRHFRSHVGSSQYKSQGSPPPFPWSTLFVIVVKSAESNNQVSGMRQKQKQPLNSDGFSVFASTLSVRGFHQLLWPDRPSDTESLWLATIRCSQWMNNRGHSYPVRILPVLLHFLCV